MTELEVNFAKLNEQIIVYFHSNNEAQLVQESKELFSEWIDSKRALERISTVKELLKLLKRRGEAFYNFRNSTLLIKFQFIQEYFRLTRKLSSFSRKSFTTMKSSTLSWTNTKGFKGAAVTSTKMFMVKS